MFRKSYIPHHTDQEMRRGNIPYASTTSWRSSTQVSTDFQLPANSLNNKFINPFYLQDEDSDERTVYFANSDGNKNKSK